MTKWMIMTTMNYDNDDDDDENNDGNGVFFFINIFFRNLVFEAPL